MVMQFPFKLLLAVALIGGLLAAGFVVARRSGSLVSLSGTSSPVNSPATPMAGTTASPIPRTPEVAAPVAAASASPTAPAPFNLVALDAGGHIESVTSEHDDRLWPARGLIDADPNTAWSSVRSAGFPHEIVFSFFERQPALVSAVILNAAAPDHKERWARDVEVWTSMDSATTGFVKIANATLRPEPGEQTIPVQPIEARFVKLRVLSNNGDANFTELSELKVTEGQRAGYTPLITRVPQLAALLSAAHASGAPADSVRDVPVPGAATAGCTASSPAQAAPPPRHPETQHALVVTSRATDNKHYPPLDFQTMVQRDHTDLGVDGTIYERVRFDVIKPSEAGVASLARVDTVVISQVCDIKTSVSDSFKKALMAWVAQGNKLIINDADVCGKSPDYGFLPYRFSTSNPGAHGQPSDRLLFVEENTIGNATEDDRAFLDIPAWLGGRKPESNEIGDSNTIIAYDPHWCGHLFGTNVLKKNGFMEAYAHYGRGLIIYDGFDIDQTDGKEYRQLITRELLQPFDPDNLPCSAHLGDFVITTEQRLKTLPMVPARTYTYPLTLLSNQAYKGTITLGLTTTPADSTVSARFEPESVDLTEIAQTTLTVTTVAASPRTAHTFAVRGTDAAGKSNALCLALVERKTGGLQVVTNVQPAKKPTKNLEIILDASGSMKLRLGKSTRWATALDVFSQVVAKLPDDFNVGLRVYGHRYPSKSPKTCTDTQLLLRPASLDRSRILSAIRSVKPRGETPLVYSVLQTTADLKPLGGGTVIVITDGEESCGGNPLTAAQQLKDSGIDITLDIVGFTLTGQKVQQQLTQFAEATGGRYYSAQNGEALARALLVAAVEKFPYVVRDPAGVQVAKGQAGAPMVELAPGDYKVVVRAGDQELSAPVTVKAGGDTIVRVSLKEDRFVIER